MDETDREVAACRAVVEALEPLDVAAQGRVIRWANDRYASRGLEAMQVIADHLGDVKRAVDEACKTNSSPEIKDFAKGLLQDPKFARLALLQDGLDLDRRTDA